MFRELVLQLWTDAEFPYPPVSNGDLDAAQAVLNVRLPEDLRKFLLETGGFKANYSASYVWSIGQHVSPFDELLNRNREMRTFPDFEELYQPFSEILFIGDDGGGGLWGYRIADGVCTTEIVHWDHEDDSRTVVTDQGLSGYLDYASKNY